MTRILLALAVGLLLGATSAREAAPGLVVLCESGGVAPNESHLGSGYHCVLHDKSGSAASAGAISIYDDSMAVP